MMQEMNVFDYVLDLQEQRNNCFDQSKNSSQDDEHSNTDGVEIKAIIFI